jgi:hypothetical protein
MTGPTGSRRVHKRKRPRAAPTTPEPARASPPRSITHPVCGNIGLFLRSVPASLPPNRSSATCGEESAPWGSNCPPMIIDCHTHVFPDDVAERAMAALHAASRAEPINDWLLGLSDERLIPFGAVHPHLEDVAGELDRLEQAGILGPKLQPFFQGFTLTDDRTLAGAGLRPGRVASVGPAAGSGSRGPQRQLPARDRRTPALGPGPGSNMTMMEGGARAATGESRPVADARLLRR